MINDSAMWRRGSRFLMMFAALLLFSVTAFAADTAGAEKTGNLAVLYCITSILALLLLVGCVWFVRHKNCWFVILFVSVFVVNVGYLALAVSGSLRAAMIANAVSYFGSVFLPLSMLMIILEVCKLKPHRVLLSVLTVISIATFLLVASGCCEYCGGSVNG